MPPATSANGRIIRPRHLSDVKRRFGLVDNSEHDRFLEGLLRRRLACQDGQYVWPPAVRSMLVYWDVSH